MDGDHRDLVDDLAAEVGEIFITSPGFPRSLQVASPWEWACFAWSTGQMHGFDSRQLHQRFAGQSHKLWASSVTLTTDASASLGIPIVCVDHEIGVWLSFIAVEPRLVRWGKIFAKHHAQGRRNPHAHG
jgi:hypothetical protein